MLKIQSEKSGRRVHYAYSDQYRQICDKLPSNINRSTLVHSLIKSYGFFEEMTLLSPSLGTNDDFETYHSSELTETILSFDNASGPGISEDELEKYGLLYDCPTFPGLGMYTRYLVGTALAAAELLIEDEADVVINWDGGRHHAKHGAASGFCYVNDIVISIIQMSQEYEKVMYIDLDLHHGDGVEEAFYHTSKVLTVSLHRYDAGFFPGTGSRANQGKGRGLYHALNIPLKAGLNDQALKTIFDEVVGPAFAAYKPEAIVLQCGADGLVGDRHREWNLSLSGFSYCLAQVLAWKLPTLLLGGGGYNHPNTARCYAQLTSIVLGSPLISAADASPVEIPEHEFVCEYLPDCTLQLTPGPRMDENSGEYLTELIISAKAQIQALMET